MADLVDAPEGWYLTSSPIITANWNATSGNRWNFPIGGGIGKILKIGDQPINVGLQAFDCVQSAKRWTPVDAPPSGAVPLPTISW